MSSPSTDPLGATQHQRLGPVDCRVAATSARRSVASSESWTRTSVRCVQSAAGMPATHLGMKSYGDWTRTSVARIQSPHGMPSTHSVSRALPGSRTRFLRLTKTASVHTDPQGTWLNLVLWSRLSPHRCRPPSHLHRSGRRVTDSVL
jgi:hypothetical protein